LAWSYATIGLRDGPLLHALAAEAIRILPQFNPQDLGNTAWAFATLGVRDEPLMEAISGESI